MGITINRAIEDIEYISNWNVLPTIGYRKGEDVIISEKSLKLAIEIMRKYQKIEKIVEPLKQLVSIDEMSATEYEILEVIEDGDKAD